MVSIGYIHKYAPESREAITRLANLTDADRLTDRQLKPSDPGAHSMHASSPGHRSLRLPEAPRTIKLAMEFTKLFNPRSGSETALRSVIGANSIDSWLEISRNADMALGDSGGRGSRTGPSIRILKRHWQRAPVRP